MLPSDTPNRPGRLPGLTLTSPDEPVTIQAQVPVAARPIAKPRRSRVLPQAIASTISCPVAPAYVAPSITTSYLRVIEPSSQKDDEAPKFASAPLDILLAAKNALAPSTSNETAQPEASQSWISEAEANEGRATKLPADWLDYERPSEEEYSRRSSVSSEFSDIDEEVLAAAVPKPPKQPLPSAPTRLDDVSYTSEPTLAELFAQKGFEMPKSESDDAGEGRSVTPGAEPERPRRRPVKKASSTKPPPPPTQIIGRKSLMCPPPPPTRPPPNDDEDDDDLVDDTPPSSPRSSAPSSPPAPPLISEDWEGLLAQLDAEVPLESATTMGDVNNAPVISEQDAPSLQDILDEAASFALATVENSSMAGPIVSSPYIPGLTNGGMMDQASTTEEDFAGMEALVAFNHAFDANVPNMVNPANAADVVGHTEADDDTRDEVATNMDVDTNVTMDTSEAEDIEESSITKMDIEQDLDGSLVFWIDPTSSLSHEETRMAVEYQILEAQRAAAWEHEQMAATMQQIERQNLTLDTQNTDQVTAVDSEMTGSPLDEQPRGGHTTAELSPVSSEELDELATMFKTVQLGQPIVQENNLAITQIADQSQFALLPELNSNTVTLSQPSPSPITSTITRPEESIPDSSVVDANTEVNEEPTTKETIPSLESSSHTSTTVTGEQLLPETTTIGAKVDVNTTATPDEIKSSVTSSPVPITRASLKIPTNTRTAFPRGSRTKDADLRALKALPTLKRIGSSDSKNSQASSEISPTTTLALEVAVTALTAPKAPKTRTADATIPKVSKTTTTDLGVPETISTGSTVSKTKATGSGVSRSRKTVPKAEAVKVAKTDNKDIKMNQSHKNSKAGQHDSSDLAAVSSDVEDSTNFVKDEEVQLNTTIEHPTKDIPTYLDALSNIGTEISAAAWDDDKKKVFLSAIDCSASAIKMVNEFTQGSFNREDIMTAQQAESIRTAEAIEEAKVQKKIATSATRKLKETVLNCEKLKEEREDFLKQEANFFARESKFEEKIETLHAENARLVAQLRSRNTTIEELKADKVSSDEANQERETLRKEQSATLMKCQEDLQDATAQNQLLIHENETLVASNILRPESSPVAHADLVSKIQSLETSASESDDMINNMRSVLEDVQRDAVLNRKLAKEVSQTIRKARESHRGSVVGPSSSLANELDFDAESSDSDGSVDSDETVTPPNHLAAELQGSSSVLEQPSRQPVSGFENRKSKKELSERLRQIRVDEETNHELEVELAETMYSLQTVEKELSVVKETNKDLKATSDKNVNDARARIAEFEKKLDTERMCVKDLTEKLAEANDDLKDKESVRIGESRLKHEANMRVIDIKQELETCKNAAQSTNEELAALKKSYDQLEKERDEATINFQTQLMARDATMITNQKMLDELDATQESTQEQIRQFQAVKKDDDKKIEGLVEEINKKNALIKNHKTEITSIESNLTESERLRAQLSATRDQQTAQQDHEEKLATLTAEKQKINQILEEKEEMVKKLHTHHAAEIKNLGHTHDYEIEKLVQKHNAAIEEHRSTYNNLEKTHEKSIAELNSQLVDPQDADFVKQKLVDLQDKCNRAIEDVSQDHAAQIATLKRQNADHINRINKEAEARINRKIAEVEKEHNSLLVSENANRASESQSLKKKIAELNEKLDKVEASLAEALRTKEDLEGQLNIQRSINKNMVADRTKLSAALLTAEADVEALKITEALLTNELSNKKKALAGTGMTDGQRIAEQKYNALRHQVSKQPSGHASQNPRRSRLPSASSLIFILSIFWLFTNLFTDNIVPYSAANHSSGAWNKHSPQRREIDGIWGVEPNSIANIWKITWTTYRHDLVKWMEGDFDRTYPH